MASKTAAATLSAPAPAPGLGERLEAALKPGDLGGAPAAAEGFVSALAGPADMGDAAVVAALGRVLAGTDKKQAAARAAALAVVSQATKRFGAEVLPFVERFLTDVLALMADKSGKVVQGAAGEAATAVVDALNPVGKRAIALPHLVAGLGMDRKWQTQAGALGLILKMAKDAPQEIGSCMPVLVPAVSPYMCEAKAAVSETSKKAMQEMCTSIDNTDIQPLVPSLISALEKPDEVEDTIYKLAATTFVAQVECNALAITVPLLKRAFQSRNTSLKRVSAKIVANMAKLVERPSDIAPFMPSLMPALQRAAEEISDPEARSVCADAVEVLDGASKGEGMQPELPRAQPELVLKELETAIPSVKSVGPVVGMAASFVVSQACVLIDNQVTEKDEWTMCVSPAFKPFTADPASCVGALKEGCDKFIKLEEEEEDDMDAEELCRCKFSLAYGSKVLLNNTELRLKRGFRYGLLGPNECGKTTLMRAIANDQVEGFPPASEVRTVFVEADILGELSHLNVIDYVFADEAIQNCGVPRDRIGSMLGSVGFTQAMLDGSVSFLSGGWRMKLALGRAMLQDADILLLDEPTNHLDTVNVKWVEDYLNGLKEVTSIIVSHDSGLLERVCTHIIQIENLKLKLHKGNLSEFVKKVPKAKSYFELKESKLQFKFPPPGNLDGITSKGKAIIKMDDVTFTYPTASRPQIAGVTIRCSLASRVACIGPNGAGKSTIIKLLTGELEPDSGRVWKHPNCRVGYIAQHAFEHIENHLDKTANEYIRWRYAYGEDREALQKSTMQVSDEEMKLMKEPVLHVWFTDEGTKEHRQKLVVDKLSGQRRTVKGTKQDYEYEVKWEGKPSTFTAFLAQEKLEKMGWSKGLKAVDEKVASRASSYAMPLTASNVEKHLENIGLDREFGTHCRISSLSGGQKVKVALAASMWACPHIVILDEPTNYLDRESLGALVGAIKIFEGGVVIISHNAEFTGQVCPEIWNLEPATDTEPAKLNLAGDLDWTKNAEKEKIEVKQMEEMTDAFGNTVKVAKAKQKKGMSRQEKKKLDRKRAAQKAAGEYYEGINGTDDEAY